MKREEKEREILLDKILEQDKTISRLVAEKDALMREVREKNRSAKKAVNILTRQWRMWRPDVKKENLNDNIEKLKERYPNAEYEIFTNKNNNLSIRYRMHGG